MRCRSFLVLGVAATALPVHAEQVPAERALSLAEARALAERATPDVLLARRREAVARAQVDVAGALANPTLTVSTARLTARLLTAVSVPVPLFGQRSTAITAAASDADAVALDTEAVRVDARWNVTRAWLDLWETQERARMAETTAAETDRLAGIAKERFAAGSAPRLDVVRTGADQARARAEARAAEMNVAAAAARLEVWLGATGGPPSVLRARPISVRCLPNRPCGSSSGRITRRSPGIRPRSPPPPRACGPRSACVGRSSTWSSRSPREIPPCPARTSSAGSPSRRRC